MLLVEPIDNFTLELGKNSELGLAVSLALMLYSVALGLKIEQFAFIKTQPRVYLTGVLGQIIGLPLLVLLIVHNSLAFALGNGLARLVKSSMDKRIALTYEIGIQNSGLAIVILLTQLGGLGGAVVVVGFWGTWHIIAGLLLVLWYRVR